MARGFPDWKGHDPQKSYEQLTREKHGFWGHATKSGDAGKSTRAQLLNPVGSGIDILLHRIVLNTYNYSEIRVGTLGSPLTYGSALFYNRYVGGTPSTAEIRYESSVDVILAFWGKYYSLPDIDRQIDLSYLWVPPGTDVVVQCAELNTTMTVNFWWFEMVEF